MPGEIVSIHKIPSVLYTDLNHRNELFVTAGANKSLSFYREASGT
jgi:hypothetical protein